MALQIPRGRTSPVPLEGMFGWDIILNWWIERDGINIADIVDPEGWNADSIDGTYADVTVPADADLTGDYEVFITSNDGLFFDWIGSFTVSETNTPAPGPSPPSCA